MNILYVRQSTTNHMALWRLYLKGTANYSFTRWNIKKTKRTTTFSIRSCCENFTLNYFHSLYNIVQCTFATSTRETGAVADPGF